MRRALLRKNASGGGFAFGNALDFDGVDDYLDIPYLSAIGDFTYSCWANYDTLNAIFISNSTTGVHFIRTTSSTQIQYRVNTSTYFTIPTLSTGTWYHFMFTRSSGNGRVYVNGVESSSGSQAVGTINLAFNFMGKRSTGDFMDGKYDECAFWNGTVGTLTNAKDLYNSGAGALASDVIASPTWYYRMNESGTDTIAVDSSGNGNDGTLTNFPASGMWVAH